MASLFGSDDDSNSIENDSIEFYDKKYESNEGDKPLNDEESEILKPSLPFQLEKTSSRLFSTINRAGKALRYRSGLNNNRLRSLPSSELINTKSGQNYHLKFILPYRLRQFDTVGSNDKNNLRYKTTDTSINGFKNSTSTNYEPEVQQKQQEQNTDPENFFKTVNLPPKQEQLHSHQTRSIINNNIIRSDELVSSGSAGISFDRVEISWIKPTVPLTTILGVSLIGIIILGIIIIFWLKNLLFQRSKGHNDTEYTKNCENNRTDNQNFLTENLQGMDGCDHKIYYENTDTPTIPSISNNDVVKVVNSSAVDELHSNFDNLTLNQTPKTKVLLVDKKSSPIVLETSKDICSSRFIYTPALATSLSTTTLTSSSSSLCTDNQITGTISIPVPIPVPVPIPIPVPIPTNHQIFSQQIFRPYEPRNQPEQETLQKANRSDLIKSSKTTTSSSSTCLTTSPCLSRSRRFSLCERRSHSPQATSHSVNHIKAHSITRLSQSRKDHDDFDLKSVQQTLNSFSVQYQSDINTELNRNLNTDDKENEIPAGGEVYSPKMKQSEQALAQQNSPRSFDLPAAAAAASSIASRFTFSPKKTLNNSENSTVPTVVSSIITSTTNQSSPIITSAVYKGGHYFKFPEVDCFIPDQEDNSDSSTSPIPKSTDDSDTPKILNDPINNKSNLSTPINQSSRRARLKSISLDSDSARFAEDNLGIAVEELIELANQSPILADDCFVFDDTTNNQNNINNKAEHPKTSHEANEVSRDHIYSKFTSKNKHNLTINIQPEQEDVTQKNSNLFPNIQTPKTPTLTQTKQKAISLDSSDTNIIYCLPQPSNVGTSQQRQFSNSKTISLLQISSISVPTTPKRQHILSSSIMPADRKLQSNKHLKGRLGATSSIYAMSKSTTSTPSTSFDHESSIPKTGFMSKLRSFNENTIPDDDDNYYEDENFFIDANEEMIIIGKRTVPARNRRLSHDLEVEPYAGFTGSSSNLLGANLQNQKCTSSLSLSNNNLKTLPEVMTISDFSTEPQYIDDDRKNNKSAIIPTPMSTSNVVCVPKAPRFSILQRRGSTHNLTLNLNGSLGNLTTSLSVSNYSLGYANIQTIQRNFFGSSSSLSHHQIVSATATPIGLTHQSAGGPLCNMITENNTTVAATGSNNNKKNLLQRRGSNTSLTLNIKGSSCMSLNRFNSHSSLNISSMQHQHQLQQIQQHQAGTGNITNTATKRGLLERRNSNASLTLNIQNRALSISNCNLRDSACSLSSVNTNPIDYENNLNSEQQAEQQESQQNYNLSYSTTAKHRKFLSSENLNNITQCSKLNQTHVRNSTKTCFGSVSDLKPHQLQQQTQSSQDNYKMKFNYANGGANDSANSKLNNFGQSNLCSCTGVRNITTRPLSPQSTSEDFKMYLANIQLLQNATNILNNEHLRKLCYIFQKSNDIDKDMTNTDATNKLNIAFDECINDDIIDITINFEAPNDDEQKLLLRNLHQEFWDLPTNYQEKPLVFGSQAKNRYKTILPNEHSRVILDCEPGYIQEPYINANYIKGPDYTQNSYIATQGPMSNTIYEYWLMIYQNITKFNQQLKHQGASFSTISSSSSSPFDQTSKSMIKSVFEPDLTGNTSISCNFNNKEINSGNNFNQKIIMLTNFVENNRQKCSIYFPIDDGKVILITNTNEKIDSGDLVEFYENHLNTLADDNITEIVINDEKLFNQLPKVNYFIIKNSSIQKKNGFTIRKLICLYCQAADLNYIIDSDKKVLKQICFKFICFHYWFPDWPDHRSPNDIDVLLDMSLHLLDGYCETEFYKIPIDANNTQYISNQPLPIIHCSAGIGRTGCLAAILNGLRQMRSSQNDLINVDILGIVCNLRLQRGGMVQNSEQYELIHRALCLYMKRLDLGKIEITNNSVKVYGSD